MDKQPLERIAYCYYNPKRGGHVYDVSGTRIFTSSLDHELQSISADELLRRAKEQRAKERANVAAPESHACAYTTMQVPAFPGEGDNFVKLGKIAEEIVGGMTKSKAQAIVDAASARAVKKMRDDAQHFGFGPRQGSIGGDVQACSDATRKPNSIHIKEFPAAALDHRHMHGGLFVKPRGP